MILPASTKTYIMLQRNLLTPAIIRTRRLCVLAVNQRAIAITVSNKQVSKRYSALGHQLTAG